MSMELFTEARTMNGRPVNELFLLRELSGEKGRQLSPEAQLLFAYTTTLVDDRGVMKYDPQTITDGFNKWRKTPEGLRVAELIEELHRAKDGDSN